LRKTGICKKKNKDPKRRNEGRLEKVFSVSGQPLIRKMGIKERKQKILSSLVESNKE